MQIHLIDGTYELYRAYYGAPGATNADGMEVGAARGLMRSLTSLLLAPRTTHVAIAFDHVIESFRNQLFEGYKTGDGIEPELWAQFPLAEQVASALGMVVWPMVEFEADDVLATAAKRWSGTKEVERILICSPDKDLAQCVEGERVVLLDRMRNRVIAEADVMEKWGVPPGSIPDLLALMGDAADGVPGIARWGQKSASRVLAEYNRIEDIPSDPEVWTVKVRGAAGLSAKLEAERKEALLYRSLTVLRRDVPIDEELEDLRWRGPNRSLLTQISQTLGETTIMNRFSDWADA
ncbi:MAG: 5'-3' exonuclease H3TH domain-containing protein [Myxococcota bacterium]|nr:5'-3' exonuclease H3TH domain-containing protein [Myxococcota bacterium]